MKILFISYAAVTLRRGQVRPVAMLWSLADAGHQVDLLAPVSELPPHPNIRVLLEAASYRPRRWKLRMAGLRAAGRRTYDAIHAIDDAVFFARRLARWKRIPFVYDALRRFTGASGSGVPRRYRLFPSYFQRAEVSVLEKAACVFSPCSVLSADLSGLNRESRIIQLEDVPLQPLYGPQEVDKPALLKHFAIRPLAVVVCCALPDGSARLRNLLMAARKVVESAPNTAFFFKGFSPDSARKMAANLDIADHCAFLSGDDAENFLAALDIADAILLVPQAGSRYIHPQVYTLLNAPAPLVSTPASPYDEVLTDTTSVRVLSGAESMSEGVLRTIQEPLFAVGVACEGQQLVAARHSYSSFKHKVRMTYHNLSRQE